jgi:excisionase family DNA binding protein
MNGLLTVTEVCQRLRISRTTLYAHLKTGDLRTVKLGARRLFREKDIDAFIKKHLTK